VPNIHISEHVSNLNCALRLARKNIPVFPCNADKTPRIAGGFKSATCFSDQITSWWRQWPDAFIGAATGHIFDVIDIDSAKHPEAERWRVDQQCTKRLPATRMHKTRSGGYHLLYRAEEGLTNSAGKLERGVDVRAKGGYIIWWPAQGLKVWNPKFIAYMPEWILEALRAKPRLVTTATAHAIINGDATRRIKAVLAEVATASEGERSNLLYWGACRFVELCNEGLLDEAHAHDLLLEAARYAGHPDDRSLSTIDSAFKAGRLS
jgi:hypothetical protein